MPHNRYSTYTENTTTFFGVKTMLLTIVKIGVALAVLKAVVELDS